MDQLNGWQRIGVVLTGLWLVFILCLGVVGFANFETGRGPFVETIKGKGARFVLPPRAPDFISDKQMARLEKDAHSGERIPTWEESSPITSGTLVEATPDQHRFMWEALAAAAAIPPVLAWLLVCVLVTVVRWIAQGFGRTVD